MMVNNLHPNVGTLVKKVKWVNSKKVNVEIALFVECLLVKIQTLYPPITRTYLLTKTLIPILQELTINLERKVMDVNWINFAIFKLPFALLKHVADYRISEERPKSVAGEGREKSDVMHFLQPHSALSKIQKLECEYHPLGKSSSNKNKCFNSADPEEAYQRYLSMRLIRGLVPKSSQNYLFKVFLVDASYGLVIKSIISYLSDPTSINVFLIQALSTDNSFLNTQNFSSIYTQEPEGTNRTTVPPLTRNLTTIQNDKVKNLDTLFSRSLPSEYRSAMFQVHNNIHDRLVKKKIHNSLVKFARGGKNFLKNTNPKTRITNNILKVGSSFNNKPPLHRNLDTDFLQKKSQNINRFPFLTLTSKLNTPPIQNHPPPRDINYPFQSTLKKSFSKTNPALLNIIVNTNIPKPEQPLDPPHNTTTGANTLRHTENHVDLNPPKSLSPPYRISPSSTQPLSPIINLPQHQLTSQHILTSSSSIKLSSKIPLLHFLLNNTLACMLSCLYNTVSFIVYISSSSHIAASYTYSENETRNYGHWFLQLAWFVFRFDESQNKIAVYLIGVVITSLCTLFRTSLNKVITYFAYKLISEDFVVFCIRSLRESIFGDPMNLQIPSNRNLSLTKLQIRNKAFELLVKKLSPLVFILGSKHLERTTNDLLGAFQDPEINKYFAYSLVDVVFDELFLTPLNTMEPTID